MKPAPIRVARMLVDPNQPLAQECFKRFWEPESEMYIERDNGKMLVLFKEPYYIVNHDQDLLEYLHQTLDHQQIIPGIGITMVYKVFHPSWNRPLFELTIDNAWQHNKDDADIETVVHASGLSPHWSLRYFPPQRLFKSTNTPSIQLGKNFAEVWTFELCKGGVVDDVISEMTGPLTEVLDYAKIHYLNKPMPHGFYVRILREHCFVGFVHNEKDGFGFGIDGSNPSRNHVIQDELDDLRTLVESITLK